MPALVLIAEAATLLLILLFCAMLASDGVLGRVFEIKVRDPVGRTLIRNAQVAFVIGYSGFFAFSIYQMIA